MGKPTIRLIDRRRLSSVLDVRSFRAVDWELTDIWWWQRFHNERLNLKKINEVEVKEHGVCCEDN
jgi:hypothetical protein